MAAITNQTEQKTGIWEGLVSLKPLKKHFEWWLKLIAITVIPIVVVCTVITGFEVSKPDLFTHGIGLVISMIVENALNLAVEASMFGCIILAKEVRKQGSTEQYVKMRNIGIYFAVLSIITVGFMLFKANPIMDECLLIIRDASVIMYVFVSHLEDDDEQASLSPPQVADLEARLNDVISNVEKTIQLQVSHEVAKIQSSISEQVDQHLLPMLRNEVQALLPVQSPPPSLDYTQIASTLAPLFDARIRAIRTTIVEEIRASSLPLDTMTIESGQSTQSLRLKTGQQKVMKVDTSTLDSRHDEASTLDSEENIGQRIRALLIEDSGLSGRAIAARIGCSPTTANKWKTRIEAE